MKRPVISYLLLGAALLSGILSAHSETLISDDFRQSGDINGRLPKVNLNRCAWVSGKGDCSVTSNGHSVSVNTAHAQLAVVDTGVDFFKLNPGIYELSVNVTFPAQNSDGATWVGLGFNNGKTPSACFNAPNNPNGGSPWMLLRSNGSCLVFAGRGTNTPLGTSSTTSSSGQASKLTLVLDTREEAWTVKAYVNDVQIPLGKGGQKPFFFVDHPEIRFIGFSANPGGASDNASEVFASLSNFRLEKLLENDERAN